ncbi:MAG TPA: hypothetical protein VNJ01_01900 [Bacteriovoracaceae bacterium]|nr:hypothetical protein [Bacteriovoracaceae bacterium]
MKLKLTLALVFSLLLTMSCGKDGDDNSTAAGNPPPQQREEETPGTGNRKIQYSSIETDTTTDMEGYSRKIHMDLNRRPVILTGNFSDMANEDGTPNGCTFQLTLTEQQADQLEKRADRLKFCTREHEGEDGEVYYLEFKEITLTDNQGNQKTGQKFLFEENIEIDQTYLCQGRSAFYSYVKKILKTKLPVNCPANALDDI